MDEAKRVAIQKIVDKEIKKFADSYETRFTNEVNNPEGVINSKKNNCFVAELGKEFMFYSAFVRSFDSSFGKVLEKIGNEVAKLSYDVRGNIDSFLLPQQSQHMDYIILEYENMQMTPETQKNMTLNSLELARRFKVFLEESIEKLLKKELYFISAPITKDNALTAVNYFIYNLEKTINNL